MFPLPSIVCLVIGVAAAPKILVLKIPDPKIAEKKVTAIGFEGSDGLKKIFVLRRDGIKDGTNDLDPKIELKFYDICHS